MICMGSGFVQALVPLEVALAFVATTLLKSFFCCFFARALGFFSRHCITICMNTVSNYVIPFGMV